MKVKPHILMVLDQSFPPDLRVENEARTLVESGFEVSVLSIGPDDRPDMDELGGVRIIRKIISAQRRNKMRGLAGTLPFLSSFLKKQLSREFSLRPFDAIHAHDLYLFGGCIAAGKKLGVPVVGDMHENWVEALKHYKWSTSFPGKLVVDIDRWQRLELDWSNGVDRLIVVIEEMANRLGKRGIEREHMTVVPNTIHLAEFDSWPVEIPPELDKNRQRIVYTGGMDLHRGLEDAVRSMPRVIEAVPDAELLLVGDGAVRTELEILSSSLGLADAIRFVGWQEQARVKGYMASADIGLIPHKKTLHTDHTIPHKLFHYMHMSLPCVVSNCEPLERIVTETGCGKVYQSGSPSNLSDILIALLNDPDARSQMGEAGAEAVRQKYNWNATAMGLVQMYRDLLFPTDGASLT